jgi:hypothetical protein
MRIHHLLIALMTIHPMIIIHTKQPQLKSPPDSAFFGVLGGVGWLIPSCFRRSLMFGAVMAQSVSSRFVAARVERLRDLRDYLEDRKTGNCHGFPP